ncbi:unnamed protein product, partial [Timema podura]|nr:unnamed protein product [Timema podura]
TALVAWRPPEPGVPGSRPPRLPLGAALLLLCCIPDGSSRGSPSAPRRLSFLSTARKISEVSIRGMLGCYLDFMITIGFLWTYILNTFLDYFDLTISSAVLPAAFLLSFIWMPESPVYLLAKNRDDKAVKALRFFRGAKYIKDFDHRPEIEVMRDFTKEGATYSGGTTTSLGYIKECLFKLGPVSTTAKAMRIIFGLVIIAQATGIQGVIYYTVEIFQSGESSISPYICNFVVAIVQFLLSLLTVMVVDRVGRRLLLLLSGAGMAVSIAFLAMHFLMIDNKSYMANFGWMPCVTVTLFISTYASGFGPLPWLVMAEIVPTESKGWVSSICVFLSWSLQFITTKLYSIMVSEMGEPITYAIFCLFCVLSVVY